MKSFGKNITENHQFTPAYLDRTALYVSSIPSGRCDLHHIVYHAHSVDYQRPLFNGHTTGVWAVFSFDTSTGRIISPQSSADNIIYGKGGTLISGRTDAKIDAGVAPWAFPKFAAARITTVIDASSEKANTNAMRRAAFRPQVGRHTLPLAPQQEQLECCEQESSVYFLTGALSRSPLPRRRSIFYLNI
jgi:hypothetical protein